MALVFSILVVTALLSNCGHLIMRIRVGNRLPHGQRLSVWMWSSDQVADAYLQFVPDSRLPSLTEYVFWLIFAIGAGLVLLIVVMKG